MVETIKCITCSRTTEAIDRWLPKGWCYARLPSELANVRGKLYRPDCNKQPLIPIGDRRRLYDDHLRRARRHY
jgi:hypothetical protein